MRGHTPVLAMDLRCLQDGDYRERGIGRHALSLLRHARACSPFAAAHPLVGLADPALPALPDAVRALLDRVQHHDYVSCPDGSRFVSPSPMTHAPAFVARLATWPGTLAAAALHDFIPLDEPGRYLPTPADRLDYRARLTALSWFGVLLPNSADTAARLQDLLPTVPGRVRVTGAGLSDAFDDLSPAPPGQPPTHVLAVGGTDPRKNVELAVRAHAVADVAVPLVVTGAYGRAEIGDLVRLHARSGGRPGRILFPDHVDDARLVELYRRALCVVAPSRNEGFSLPLVEGMAAHVPVLASDIPAHRELVTDGALLFPVGDQGEDPGPLAVLMGRAADEGWRRRVVSRQEAVWPAFRGRAVAARFWSALDAAWEPAAPAISRRCRPRVALVTPLPPDRSGVADYSLATAAELGRLVELTVLTPTLDPGPVPGATAVVPLSGTALTLPGFDRVVTVMGNSHFHRDIFHAQLRHGGACVCHDNQLLLFYQYILGRERTLAAASAELGRPVGSPEVDGWLGNEATLPATFLGDLAASAQPLLLHSRTAARRLEERLGVRPAVLPFSVYRTWTEGDLSEPSRRAARQRLGVPDGEVLVASFGYVHGNKAPEDCLWAVAMLRQWGFPVRLVFVGGVIEGHDALLALRDSLGLRDRVAFGAYAAEAAWRDHLLAADLGLQLRTYGGGLSGALLDGIAAGLPTVATADMADAMEAPSYVRRTPDRIGPVLVAEALADMIESGLHRTRSTVERRAFLAGHGQAAYSRRLCEALGLSVGEPS